MKGGRKAHHHKKASGGRTHLVASGNPDVLKEAEGKESYAEGDERKRGGKVKKKEHHRATGGKVLGLMTGGGVKPRMDRPGRKRGGGVGADMSPLSTAFRTAKNDKEPKEQEGGMSPE
jgi:hypothetical protein